MDVSTESLDFNDRDREDDKRRIRQKNVGIYYHRGRMQV